MHNTWKVVTVAAIVLAGCGKGGKTEQSPDKAPGSSPSGGGEQTYTIKLKSHPAVGNAVANRETENTTANLKITDAAGKVLKDSKENSAKEIAYVETLIEAGEKAPKKFKRKYENATETKDGKLKHYSYEGKTIVFEQAGDVYKPTVEGGGAIDDIDFQTVLKKANHHLKHGDEMEAKLLPKKPVKVGETWTIDNRLFNDEDDNMQLDLDKSKAEAKLAKVYQKDGKQFGIIEFKGDLVVKNVKGLAFDPPATFGFSGSLDVAIDGSTTAGNLAMKVKLAGKSKVDQAGQKFTMELGVVTDGRGEHSNEMAPR